MVPSTRPKQSREPELQVSRRQDIGVIVDEGNWVVEKPVASGADRFHAQPVLRGVAQMVVICLSRLRAILTSQSFNPRQKAASNSIVDFVAGLVMIRVAFPCFSHCSNGGGSITTYLFFRSDSSRFPPEFSDTFGVAFRPVDSTGIMFRSVCRVIVSRTLKTFLRVIENVVLAYRLMASFAAAGISSFVTRGFHKSLNGFGFIASNTRLNHNVSLY